VRQAQLGASYTLVRQAQLGASYRVKVFIGQSLAGSPYRVLRVLRRDVE